MQLGLVTIQRNRGPWLVEWFAFHHLMGFRKFYFYAHLCTDQTEEILSKLSRKFNITSMKIDSIQDQIQLSAYQHACDNFINEVDWMCFLDGDEFMFPTAHSTLQETLDEYSKPSISAIGVYNVNFGSSGHISEPEGLITENYRMRAKDEFLSQRRVKSFVKGHQKISATNISNLFFTEHGTVDEMLRPVTWGYMPEYTPTYKRLCFNHYACQSYSYYLNYKKHSGHADAGSKAVREHDWWVRFDTNDFTDYSLVRFSSALRIFATDICAELELPLPPPPPKFF